MRKVIDLEKHPSITTANSIDKIVKPLAHAFGIKHFRYLKLYGDGSRVLLSNYPDCTRYMYEEGKYKKMWYDGEFPEYLKEGSYAWNVNRLSDNSEEEIELEKDINDTLKLYHGITFVKTSPHFHEVYSFDTENTSIYHLNPTVFLRFMFYFKSEARKIIRDAEHQKIFIPVKKNLLTVNQQGNLPNITEFLKETKINRYYLSGEYQNVYLTEREMRCIYWLIQGKTAEETAVIEGNKLKTVQCHFENIKKKLRCYKQTQLVQIVLASGILDIFEP